MEEQRQRQEDEQRRAQANSVADAPVDAIAGTTSAVETAEPHSEEAMLQRALALSTETPVKRERPVRSNIHLLFFLSFHTFQILKRFLCFILNGFFFLSIL